MMPIARAQKRVAMLSPYSTGRTLLGAVTPVSPTSTDLNGRLIGVADGRGRRAPRWQRRAERAPGSGPEERSPEPLAAPARIGSWVPRPSRNHSTPARLLSSADG